MSRSGAHCGTASEAESERKFLGGEFDSVFSGGSGIEAILEFDRRSWRYKIRPMDAAFVALVNWVIAHGYLLYFLTALVEGPIVTAAAGVAAALGYFSLPLVILISIFGDLIPDSALYAIGYFGGRPLAEKYGRFFGLTDEHFKRFDSFLKRHVGKALLFVKLTPIIPIPGVILVGSTRVRFRRFIWMLVAITIPKALFFSLLGFFSGRAYEYMSGTIVSARNATFFLGAAIIAIYLAYRAIAKRFAENVKRG